MATPLCLAAMGGYTSERGGITNIGLEGLMLMSACVTALCSAHFGALGGVACGVLSSTLLSILHWLSTQKYRIDHVISGMAINAIAAGGTNFLYGKFSDPNNSGKLVVMPTNYFVVAAIIVPFLLWVNSKYGRFGIRLMAAGSDPDKARLMGTEPITIRFWGLTATGIFCGLAGSMLVSEVQAFTDNMTAGRGYIALAALILGGWRPIPTFVACLGFGFLSALRVQLDGTQIFGANIPAVWASLPYIVTIVALAGFFGRNRTPAGIGKL